MTPMPEPACGNCRNGRPSPNGPDVVSCRARPPHVFVHDVYVSHGHALTGYGPVKGATQVLSEWPTIPVDQWCAAHRYTATALPDATLAALTAPERP